MGESVKERWDVKVLYVAGRWDPRLQNEYSGNDFGAYQALKAQPDIDLNLVGPLDFPWSIPEKAVMQSGDANIWTHGLKTADQVSLFLHS